ncbi:NAD-dependent epimerase/dehydratase family protein [Inhella gelatinilytica]|uniref:NAD-dependent epimerase/dehydratase family protein n=1 Tax=Inhella gelatinilytica TaxID=2795030 RepID=A0A931J2L8_9BURK|nr:NAD-dependent epimerase/dehydratase family protein [Inhella gelatinilytica]MBH9554333.1 NAD-dependent epimerase/dehydratase family protein [Inhella gelatinilytica]
MKLLFIGGGRFVGHHLLEAALHAGHQVTVFNRGKSCTEWPAGVDVRVGDRRSDLRALRQPQDRWDAVVDCCAYLPSEVHSLAAALQGRAARYVLISSVSAYAGFAQPNQEDSPLGSLPDDDPEVLSGTVNGRTYGPLKAMAEAAALQHWAEADCLRIRPGLVVGPQDPTQRFTYWPARLARAQDGEPVLAPGRPEAAVQWIDARDLACFTLQALEAGRHGAVNVHTAPDAMHLGAVLAEMAAALGRRPRWVWRSDAELLAAELKPWNDLPLWLPADGEYAHFMRNANARAVSWGLQTRSVVETARDTLAWWQGLPADQQGFDKAGLSAARERALLGAGA